MRSPPSSHFAPGVDLSFSPLLLWLFHSRGGLFPHEVICPSGPDPPARAILSRAVLIPRRGVFHCTAAFSPPAGRLLLPAEVTSSNRGSVELWLASSIVAGPV